MARKRVPLSREKQANREALLTLGAYGLYFLWWYGFAYGLGDTDPENYSYVLGIPAWFFYSCIIGYLVLTAVLWLMIRLFFRDIPLDAEDAEETEAPRDDDATGSGSPGGPGESATEITAERHPEAL